MKKLFKAILAGAVMLAPMSAIADIDGTHHDMTVYQVGGAAVSEQKCAYCHSVSLADIADPGIGSVGVFCAVVCHGAAGALGAAAQPDAPGFITPATLATTVGNSGVNILANSHGLSKAALANYGPNIDAPADVTATNWPHAGEADMQCTTCHAVHDGTNPPFLNAPLASGNNGTAFCNKCHTGSTAIAAGTTAARWQNIADQGAHPTEFVYSATGNAYGAAVGKNGRSIGFKAALVNAVPPTNTSVANFNNDFGGNAWIMGGHLVDTATNLPKTAATANATTRFGCYSCHSAHQDDVNNALNLTLGVTNAVHVGGESSSILCISCHGDEAANVVIWDAGDTGYGHPANEDADLPYEHDHATHAAVNHPNVPTTGTFPIDVAADIAGFYASPAVDNLTANDVGLTDGEILCTTCHDVHGGVIGQMAIRKIGNVDTAAELICNACHGTDDQPTGGVGINRHHPTVAVADIDAGYNTAAALAWDAQYGNSGNMTMADGLGCGDCHAFGSTAHNW